jgi:hypothetical protein
MRLIRVEPFQHSIIFANKVWPYPTRLDLKNAPAYQSSSLTNIKTFNHIYKMMSIFKYFFVTDDMAK